MAASTIPRTASAGRCRTALGSALPLRGRRHGVLGGGHFDYSGLAVGRFLSYSALRLCCRR